MLEPAPAPSSTRTWCPAAVSSRAPSGVSATRYSLSLTSLGTPTITVWPFPRPGCGKRTRPGDDAGVASDRLDRVHEPGARHALELVFPAFGEHDARTGDEIGHGARDQDLARARRRSPPRPYAARPGSAAPDPESLRSRRPRTGSRARDRRTSRGSRPPPYRSPAHAIARAPGEPPGGAVPTASARLDRRRGSPSRSNPPRP